MYVYTETHTHAHIILSPFSTPQHIKDIAKAPQTGTVCQAPEHTQTDTPRENPRCRCPCINQSGDLAAEWSRVIFAMLRRERQ